ncbi:MAG: hypothetical protein O3A00_25800 [Planctomycetota bacterium]|nr:hypothetical protein [Planctomycetota bacterium]
MHRLPRAATALFIAIISTSPTDAQLPEPVINRVLPAGGQRGTHVDVVIVGSNLTRLKTLRASHPGITAEVVEKNRVRVNIGNDVLPGSYDLQTVCENGVSSPRTFVVGNRTEIGESTTANDDVMSAVDVPLNVVVNGSIEPGDRDCFRFTAKKGRRVLVECAAERIDSHLRAVLEVFDERGRRLAVNRGYWGIDPLIDFRVPHDGRFVVRVSDLIFSGSADHFYRLSINTQPRVAFAIPAVIQRGRTAQVTLFGWNLGGESKTTTPMDDTLNGGSFERISVDISAPLQPSAVPLRLRPTQVSVDGFAYHHPGSSEPILIGLTEVPVVGDATGNHTATSATPIEFPCELSGQLAGGDEQDWFRIEAKRGEVLWIEGFGERIGSPLDLEISVMDQAGQQELVRFTDEIRNLGGRRFPTNHADPAGRWVAPRDGSYFIVVRNATSGLKADPRRVYRLSVLREIPIFHLAVVPRTDSPQGINVPRGGRTAVDVLAVRRRGMTGEIQVRAKNLPPGVTCPSVWLGANIERVPLVFTSDRDAKDFVGPIQIEGIAPNAEHRIASGTTVVHGGRPQGWSRLTDEVSLAVSGDAPIRLLANGNEPRDHHLFGKLTVRHSPGSIVDVAVQLDRVDANHQAPVKLGGVGMPASVRNQTVTLPPGREQGTISFYLPPTMAVGRFTFAVEAQTTAPWPVGVAVARQKPRSFTAVSNPVTIDVQPAAFVVEIDRDAPRRIRRGETLQIKYTAKRINGFIGKMHTELYAAGPVIGLRGRGVTFVGQTESGNIQIIANEDAPLGRQSFLRFYAVGVVEDQAVYHGSAVLNLEIVE